VQYLLLYQGDPAAAAAAAAVAAPRLAAAAAAAGVAVGSAAGADAAGSQSHAWTTSLEEATSPMTAATAHVVSPVEGSQQQWQSREQQESLQVLGISPGKSVGTNIDRK
jgi:hypothetical protein